MNRNEEMRGQGSAVNESICSVSIAVTVGIYVARLTILSHKINFKFFLPLFIFRERYTWRCNSTWPSSRSSQRSRTDRNGDRSCRAHSRRCNGKRGACCASSRVSSTGRGRRTATGWWRPEEESREDSVKVPDRRWRQSGPRIDTTRNRWWRGSWRDWRTSWRRISC